MDIVVVVDMSILSIWDFFIYTLKMMARLWAMKFLKIHHTQHARTSQLALRDIPVHTEYLFFLWCEFIATPVCMQRHTKFGLIRCRTSVTRGIFCCAALECPQNSVKSELERTNWEDEKVIPTSNSRPMTMSETCSNALSPLSGITFCLPPTMSMSNSASSLLVSLCGRHSF